MPTHLFENAPDAPLTPREREGLLEILRRRQVLLACLIAPLPITVIAAVVAPALSRYAIVLSMAVFAVSVLRHSLARCPRCGDFFSRMHPLTKECVACGLGLDKLAAEGDGRPTGG